MNISLADWQRYQALEKEIRNIENSTAACPYIDRGEVKYVDWGKVKAILAEIEGAGL